MLVFFGPRISADNFWTNGTYNFKLEGQFKTLPLILYYPQTWLFENYFVFRYSPMVERYGKNLKKSHIVRLASWNEVKRPSVIEWDFIMASRQEKLIAFFLFFYFYQQHCDQYNPQLITLFLFYSSF